MTACEVAARVVTNLIPAVACHRMGRMGGTAAKLEVGLNMERWNSKLVTADEAVKVVKSGDIVAVSPQTGSPLTLCSALFRRQNELSNVRIDHPMSRFSWIQAEAENPFRLYDIYLSPENRDLVNKGLAEYLPVGPWYKNQPPVGMSASPDVFLVSIGPPNSDGFCAFYNGVWWSKNLAKGAKTVIGEVREDTIRTGGDNFIHVSEIDYLVRSIDQPPPPPVPPRTQEETEIADVICSLIAAELIQDRACLQVGIGTYSSAVLAFLDDKHDLGLHSEMLPGGAAGLVRQGIITGKYKQMHPGKVTFAAIVQLSAEDLSYVDGNPVFESYDFGYIDDIRFTMQNDNFVSVNNGLICDLTGQVTAETIGHRIWTGAGGLSVFPIAAKLSNGGCSIIALRSSHEVKGERLSNIVCDLLPGTVVTVQRGWVDYLVTEYGIAALTGKTVKERARELIAVAHPDFRPQLKDEARRHFGI